MKDLLPEFRQLMQSIGEPAMSEEPRGDCCDVCQSAMINDLRRDYSPKAQGYKERGTLCFRCSILIDYCDDEPGLIDRIKRYKDTWDHLLMMRPKDYGD